MKNAVTSTRKPTMHKSPGIFWLLFYSALIFLYSSAGAHAAELPPTPALLPPDTLLSVDIADFTKLADQFSKTSYCKLYKDPAMAPFIDDLKDQLDRKMAESKDELLAMLIDADILPAGRVIFAMLPNTAAADAEPNFLLAAEWGKNAQKAKDTLEKILAGAVEDGARKKTEEYRGLNLTTILNDSDSAFAPVYCFIDDCLLGSTDIEILKSTIARIKGADAPALADDSDYAPTINALGPHHDLDFYVNLKQIKKLLIASDKSGVAKVRTGITGLGLDNVISLGLAVGVAREPGDSVSAKMLLKIEGEKKGICKMLELDAKGIKLPKFAPGDFFSVNLVNLDLKKAYDVLYRIAAGLSPQFAAIMNMPILPPSPDGSPGLTIKGDIIDNLGSELMVFRSLDESTSAAPQTRVKTIAAVATENRAAIEPALSRLHALFAGGRADAVRSLLGHTIYSVDLSRFLPAIPAAEPSQHAGDNPSPSLAEIPKLAFTVTDTHVVFGGEPAVEKAVRMLTTAAAPPPAWFRKAIRRVPDTVGLAGFQDNAVAARFVWETLKKENKDSQASSSPDAKRSINVGIDSTAGLTFTQTGADFFNPDLLPQFDTVSKYFGISTTYAIARRDGFFFEFKYLDPE
ncbi:MAG: DUF3352 domain-containing protein [Sedimentisphaerales bacterium]|nr:DUF3352 domain-containing protein [Sedimentisphaerales bacterium]